MQKKNGKYDLRQRAGSVKRMKILVICLALLVVFSAASWLYVDGLAYKTVHVEAGIEVSASDILKQADSGAVHPCNLQQLLFRGNQHL